jgi:hypothetical protein
VVRRASPTTEAMLAMTKPDIAALEKAYAVEYTAAR